MGRDEMKVETKVNVKLTGDDGELDIDGSFAALDWVREALANGVSMDRIIEIAKEEGVAVHTEIKIEYEKD